MRTAFGADFDLDPGYLNTPAIGVPPRFVADAVAGAVSDWARSRSSPPDYDAAVATARAAFASLVGTDASSVTIGGGVSPLLGLVAASLPRSRVVTADREFTSVTFPFAAAGHDVSEVALEALPERATGADVVTVSAVASADGARVDLDALRAATAGRDTLVVLDATQSLGWLPVDLSWADAVVGASYKWLMAPRGAAWMALSDRLAARTVPAAAGWYAGDDRWDAVYGMPLRLADDARRFDASPVWLAHVGAAASMGWLAGLDLAGVREHDVALANRVRTALGMVQADSSIVAISRAGAAEALAAAGVRAATRGGAARVGFHLYNTADDADRVLEALAG